MRSEPDWAVPGARGVPRILLQLEGGMALILASLAYVRTGESWWLFAVLFLTPDIAMLGYLRNPRFGSACYNAAHTYLAPALLAGIGDLAAWSWAIPVALIWAAHIGFDRLVGYGLKYGTAFGHTHLMTKQTS